MGLASAGATTPFQRFILTLSRVWAWAFYSADG